VKDEKAGFVALGGGRGGGGANLAIWLPNGMLICKCPRIKVGRKYLLLGESGIWGGGKKQFIHGFF
jgi:hypothetical protein